MSDDEMIKFLDEIRLLLQELKKIKCISFIDFASIVDMEFRIKQVISRLKGEV